MGARLGVTLDDIEEAALSIAGRGTELTVARVAAEVGCKPPSVYHHVPDGLFGLREIVHRDCRATIDLELFPLVERSTVNVLTAVWQWAQREPFLYAFHRHEIEHHWQVRKHVEKPWLPLLLCLDHDDAAALLTEVFDAE